MPSPRPCLHSPALPQVSFTWPGANKKQLQDVNVRVSLASRVAVLGANGAGKSTLIKMLTGGWEGMAGWPETGGRKGGAAVATGRGLAVGCRLLAPRHMPAALPVTFPVTNLANNPPPPALLPP
jgi:hypothetical protein